MLETYRYVYRQLVGSGTDQASIDALFSPDPPVLIPAFMPNPLASEVDSAAPGYLDVEFEVTQLGASQKVKIAGTGDAPKDLANQLARRIQSGTFRPRIVDGRFAETVPVAVRYYVTD